MSVHVSSETLTVVQRAMQVAEMTEGGFNIAIGPAVDAWGVIDGRHIPTESELAALRPLVDLQAVHVNVREQTIFLEKAGMRIDVGGIGKGYAADQAVDGDEEGRSVGGSCGSFRGYQNIRTVAWREENFPSVFNIHAKRERCLPLSTWKMKRSQRPVTTSDYFEHDGVRYHHILDPKTLQPARRCQSVTVIAREGIWQMGWTQGYL